MTRNSSFRTKKLEMFVIVPLDFHHTPSTTCSRPAFPLTGAFPLLRAPLLTFWIFQARRPMRSHRRRLSIPRHADLNTSNQPQIILLARTMGSRRLRNDTEEVRKGAT